MFLRACLCVCAYECDVCVHLSVKYVIGSWFNLREKVPGECNQVDCAFVLLCVSHRAEGASVYLKIKLCVSVCLFQIKVTLYKV